MTREKKPAAQSAARRAASLLTGALIVAGLAGCGGGLFQNSDTADASLTQKAKPSVALSPVQGVPQKYASKVNDQLMTSLRLRLKRRASKSSTPKTLSISSSRLMSQCLSLSMVRKLPTPST